MKIILETERLLLREFELSDIEALSTILQDAETMYAYEGPFSDEEVTAWLMKQRERYASYGTGLWAVIHKKSGEFLGQCGLTYQDWKDEKVFEVGYLFSRKYWGNGYASESAIAVRDYAFRVLGKDEVCSIIRSNNYPSMRVAIRNGMVPRDGWVKHYRGVDMDHIRFVVSKEELQKNFYIK